MSVSSATQRLERGEFEQAAAEAEAAIAQLRDAGAARGVAEAARTLAAAKASVSRLEDANVVIDEMSLRFKAQNDSAGLAEALLASAELHSAKNETDKALKALKEMPPLGSLGAAGRELEPHALKLQVSAYLAKEKPAEAKQSAQEMLALAQRSGDKPVEAAAWSSLASSGALLARDEESFGVGQEAMQAADKALALYQDTGDRKGQASALLAAARTRLAINKPSEGLQKAKDSLELSRELGQSKGVVAALELIIQAQAMSGAPMEGLRAANQELETAQGQGNKKAQADLLDMMAHTHATLREPVSAIHYARQALMLHYQAGDRSAQGWSLHTVAEMQRAQGQMQEATVTVKESQAAFMAANDRLGQEQALWTLSLLLAARGQLEKAPGRKEVKQNLRRFSRAIQDRKTDDFKEAEDYLNSAKELLVDGELYEYLAPVVQADEGAKAWLKEQGWDLDGPAETVPVYTGSHIKQFAHKGFYLNTVMTGMNFGPQFRAVHPYRKGPRNPNRDDPMQMFDMCALSVTQLPETEDWQEKTQYRHGMMDSGLQVGSVYGFPP